MELAEEEALLRDKAIKTLDLRNRIDIKQGGQVNHVNCCRVVEPE
jgi:hypothetical protein